MGTEHCYKTETAFDEGKHQYFFKSLHEMTGKRVVKAIEFSNIGQEYAGKKVYNLGFGDYDPATNTLQDNILTMNGDPYKVFGTVLNSIALFYAENPDTVLFIAGSDSTPQFAERCFRECARNCSIACKKRHQRIRMYCGYINKNYEQLNKEFDFKAGIIDWNETRATDIIDYECGKSYEAILVLKKSISLEYGKEEKDLYKRHR